MFGDNPIRPPVAGDGATLEVVNIFPTLQGEGPFAGVPAVFIRLGGCNLACSFCDTEFETFSPMTVEAIVAAVRSSGHPVIRPLAVITGGEPFRQNIRPLTDALLAAGHTVQIETNGTLWRDLDARVQIVCSPKATNGHYHPLRPDVLARCNALKFLVSAQQREYREIPDVGQGAYSIPVYVQPMDEYTPEANAANQKRAMELAMRHGARFSIQLHKILGIE